MAYNGLDLIAVCKTKKLAVNLYQDFVLKGKGEKHRKGFYKKSGTDHGLFVPIIPDDRPINGGNSGQA